MYSNLDISIKKALEQRVDSNCEPLCTCFATSTLHEVIELFVSHESHRLIIVDKEDRVIGIICLSDLLKYLITEHLDDDLNEPNELNKLSNRELNKESSKESTKELDNESILKLNNELSKELDKELNKKRSLDSSKDSKDETDLIKECESEEKDSIKCDSSAEDTTDKTDTNDSTNKTDTNITIDDLINEDKNSEKAKD